MPSAHLLIQVEGGAEARRAFSQIASDAKKATDAISAASRESAKREEKDREAVVRAATVSAAKQKQIEERLAATREKLAARAAAAEARIQDQRSRQATTAAHNTEKVMAKLAADFIKNEQRKTAAAEKETKIRDALEATSAARREQQQRRDEDYYDRSVAMAQRAAQRKQEADENYFDRLEAREAKLQANQRSRATLQRQRQSDATGNAIVSGAGRFWHGALGISERVASTVGEYGDTVRERQASIDQLRYGATQIAASGIGDVRAAPEIMAATQGISRSTGLDPQDILAAIAKAQDAFSSLGNAGDRAQYLAQVLPTLAHVALSTGDSLESIVTTSGEFQRQFGISNAQMPTALAQWIAAGRLGSIKATDSAHYMGTLGGRATRLFSSDPSSNLESLAATNALFQTAGKAGGTGAEAATRTRSFLDYITSGKGHDALKDYLGRNAFDTRGQIVTRQGESQTQAFERMIQDVYQKSHGNSTEFLDVIAGRRTEARSLGDVLFRDLRAHGGRVADYQALAQGVGSATGQNTIESPYQQVAATHQMQVARERQRELFSEQGGEGWARATDDQMRALRQSHPFLSHVIDNPMTRGMLDIGGMAAEVRVGSPAGMVAPDQVTSRRQLIHNLALQRGRQEYEQDGGPLGVFANFAPRALQQWAVQHRAEKIEKELVERDRRRGIDPDRPTASTQPIQIAPGQTVELGPNTISALRTNDPHALAHAQASAASGANPPPPEHRR